ncbi:MAG TPA: fructosamine kinase family protein [Burkholderiaceae bacterium]
MSADVVAAILSAGLGGRWQLHALNASSFCATWRAQRASSNEVLFIKSTPAAQATMLQAEADGLATLAAAGGIRTPELAGCWSDAPADTAVLALQWLDLSTRQPTDFGARLGRHLAALHGAAPAIGDGRFGWSRDNWLGGTPQRNRWSRSGGVAGWIEFWAHERLGAMADRLAATGAAVELIAAVRRVMDSLPGFFDDGHVPRASLIHGDLWSGNWGCLHDGDPVLYDPAVAISDAEAELAMMELFGAPPAGFWPAYREAAGLHEGYARRRGLYQLYHLLNHALLFGGGYAAQAARLAAALLR